MSKLLQDIWIISESGVVLFHRLFDESMDDQLFGAMMSALNAFAEELAKGGISNFEIRSKRFTILKYQKLIFIATSDKKIKNKKVIKELESIAQKFYAQYVLILEDWDGDMDHFSNFGKVIEESLQMNVDKFHEAFL